ncbi:MAG TPA: hypothetical protein VLJ68_08925 [Chitinophagaceae bacterium]|nr:hypothetical protein [Chitinophagaceae bacterium]
MKKTLLVLFTVLAGSAAISQPVLKDTNYNFRLTSVAWMPDGKSLLFSMVKFHKTNRQAPFYSRVYQYDLQSKQLSVLLENGGNLAPSPDGKQIAYMKRDDPKRSAILIYNVASKQERVIEPDTMKKNSLSWSPDGKSLLYNISYNGVNQFATIDICVLDLATEKVKQVTQSAPHKSYTPVWSPDSRKIVYYLEKGDGRDQIWLTDADGSFHKNLTNDTTTLNYYPSWIDDQTIIYTQDPESIMTMNIDGSNRRKLEGIKSSQVKFNPATKKLAYLAPDPEKKIIIFDWQTKKSSVVLDESVFDNLFW